MLRLTWQEVLSNTRAVAYAPNPGGQKHAPHTSHKGIHTFADIAFPLPGLLGWWEDQASVISHLEAQACILVGESASLGG